MGSESEQSQGFGQGFGQRFRREFSWEFRWEFSDRLDSAVINITRYTKFTPKSQR